MTQKNKLKIHSVCVEEKNWKNPQKKIEIIFFYSSLFFCREWEVMWLNFWISLKNVVNFLKCNPKNAEKSKKNGFPSISVVYEFCVALLTSRLSSPFNRAEENKTNYMICM